MDCRILASSQYNTTAIDVSSEPLEYSGEDVLSYSLEHIDRCCVNVLKMGWLKMKKSRVLSIIFLIVILSFTLTSKAVTKSQFWDDSGYATGFSNIILGAVSPYSVIHDIIGAGLMVERRSILTITVIISVFAIIILLFLILSLRKKGKITAKANSELRNQKELWNVFFDAYSSPIFIKDENLRYVFTNKAMQDFLNKSDNEITGCVDFELKDAVFDELFAPSDKEVLYKRQLIVNTVNMGDRYYKTTKFPVQMANGSFGVGGYIVDITIELEYHNNREKALQKNQLLLDVLGLTFDSKQEQLDYALHQILKLSGSQYGYIYLYDEEKQEFTLNSWTNGVMDECLIENAPKVYQLAYTGIWGEVVRQRKPIIVNDLTTPSPLKKGYPKGHVQLQRFMTVPVFIDGRIVAVVGLGNKLSDYQESDVYEITVIMNGVWNAVQRRESTELLGYERHKYLQILLSIGDAVIVVDCHKKIAMINAVACKLTGWSSKDAIGKYYKEVFVLSHEQDGVSIEDPIEKVFDTRDVQQLGNHAILTSKYGKKYNLEDSASPFPDDKRDFAGVVIVFRDVTDKKIQRKKIEYMSFHDPLTGLYNRRFFEEEMHRIDTVRNLPISIIMGDVNSLKLTNDIFGHSFGDVLLKSIADMMHSACRADDIIARWGGDEFVLLLPRTSYEDAANISQRIKKEVSELQIRAVRGSISIGYDSKTQADEDIVHTLNRAESKMYSVKTLEHEEVQNFELNSIINTLYENNEQEKGHSERVCSICREIGRALDLPESDVQKLALAGRLHDIGKIALEPELLDRNHIPNSAEWNEIKQHPVVGYRILNYFSETLDVAEAVFSHHEHWDGNGYVKGLKGEAIPLFSRIIAVAESYDRLVNTPLIQFSKSSEAAVDELKQRAGTRFDPKIVDVFAKIISTKTNSEKTLIAEQ